MASLRHIEFVMTSSFCTRELLKSNIVLNFQVDSLSWANVNALVVNGVRCENSILWPPKGTSLCASASFKLLSVKIRLGVWPVCWSEKKINSHIKKLCFIHLLRRPPRTDFRQIWCDKLPRWDNQPWQILEQSAQGFWFYRRPNFRIFP